MASIQGWGRETWNSGAWNQQAPVSVTGNGLTSSLGTETVSTDQNISVTGIGLTSTAGTLTAVGIAEVNPSGTSLTFSIGTETVATDQNISVTGVATTSSIGTFSISGDSQTTVVAASEPQLDISLGTLEADPEFVVFPSGNALTSALGTVETSVFVTGVGMTLSLGDETQETLYAAPSVSVLSTVGTVTVSASSALTATGVSVTSSTGTLGGTFWNQVDDSNSDISWTEVHKAA